MTDKAPKIWVDADACPVVIKNILFKAATRAEIETTLVANHSMTVPNSPYLQFIQVQQGFDVADNLIVQRANAHDLIITQDIPLAAEIVELGATALNPRGERYTAANIKARLNMRDFMETLRSSGVQTGGPAAFNDQDKRAFANALDQWITRQQRQARS